MPTELTKTNKAFAADISCEDGERAVTAKISARVLDRDGEVLMPMGCDASEYEKNPVVFWNHDYSTPIGKCVAIKRGRDFLTAKTIFAKRPETHPEGEEWLPDTLFSLYQQGVLNAFSIGAEYVQARAPTQDDLKEYGDACRRVVGKWKMFEYSAVPIPANQEAVATMVSKGLMKAETAKSLFGVGDGDHITNDGGAGDSSGVDPGSNSDDIADGGIVRPVAKRLVYVIPASAHLPPSKDSANMVSTVVAEQIAKRKGLIYYSV